MEIQNKIKHKKRRTRKNLDEMRKRSRIMMKEDLNSKNDGIKKYSHVLKRNNQQITADRLTLTLFNKAVKSETVTRPIRSDQKENIKIYCKPILRSIPNYLQLSEKLLDGNKKVCLINEQQNMRFQVDQTDNENVTASSSPDSTKLLTLSIKNTCNTDLSEQEFAMPDSYLNSDTDCNHCTYDEFITNVSAHLINNIPALTKEEVMKKNFGYLHQTYLESCHRETESNILKCLKNNDNSGLSKSGQVIIENPMDYIQINTCWQQRVQSQHYVSVSDNSGSPMSHHNSSLNVLRLESPEYIYFPHKLNQ